MHSLANEFVSTKINEINEGLEKNKDQNKIEYLKKQIKELSEKSEEQKYNELCNFLDGHLQVKKKKSMDIIPLSVKQRRVLLEEEKIKNDTPKKTSEEIKLEIEKLKNNRMLVKIQKEKEKEEKYKKTRRILKKIYEQQMSSRVEKEGNSPPSNSQQTEQNKVFTKPKLTLDVLKNLNYRDINIATRETAFKPSDFVLDDQDDDVELLKEICGPLKRQTSLKKSNIKQLDRQILQPIKKLPQNFGKVEKNEYSFIYSNE